VRGGRQSGAVQRLVMHRIMVPAGR
jgi:hypothetical protein